MCALPDVGSFEGQRRWEAKEKWRRRSEDAGGCIKQQIVDALWELSDRFDVGVWHRRVEEKVSITMKSTSTAASL